MAAEPPSEHGPRILGETLRRVSGRVYEVPEGARTPRNGEAAEGRRDQDQTVHAPAVRDRQVLCDGSAEGRSKDVRPINVEPVQDPGGKAGQAKHRHKPRPGLRPADARRVERDCLEPLEVGQQRLPEQELGPNAGQQQERRAFSAHLDGHVDAADLQLLGF